MQRDARHEAERLHEVLEFKGLGGDGVGTTDDSTYPTGRIVVTDERTHGGSGGTWNSNMAFFTASNGSIELARLGENGISRRKVKVIDFIEGPGKTQIEDDEIATAMI